MPRWSGRPQGFTLIELLVVIAIISILASILFPVFSRARAKGREADCISNVRQLCMAFAMYANDADEIMPVCTTTFSWCDALYPYTRNRQIYTCKERKDKPVGYGMNWLANGRAEGTFWDTASKILLADSIPSNPPSLVPWVSPPEWWVNDPGNDICMATANMPPDPRHNEGAIFGYVDGHSKHGRVEQLDTPINWDPTYMIP